ncbi:TPM domain-containing protein [Sphingomicrobium arenosum]|uniref:TPM domain-containing protein n=1 Tax=Sphingomicrobium arenosum TaxID=2233861 RepID=UPI00223F4773|nr:hypothetical protein [Sphingomicrobium arenosum]
MHKLTAEDHARVSAAIAQAEKATDGEIVAVATDLSDKYHDAAWQWAALAMFVQMGLWAFVPGLLEDVYHFLFGGWGEVEQDKLLLTVLMLALAKFLGVWLILNWMPLRLLLVPPATKTRRVRRRAIDIYKAGADKRTVRRTGILIYLSMGEHRAEIIHDEAITKAVAPDAWGEAMIALLGPVKEGRVADGICAAIGEIGEVLAKHFPKSVDNPNEIPDKLIEL